MTHPATTRFLHVANGTCTTRLTEAAAIAGNEVLAGVVTVTKAGRAVLAGQQDRITTCGIERWLGGVHLQSDVNVWRWDGARQRIAKQ